MSPMDLASTIGGGRFGRYVRTCARAWVSGQGACAMDGWVEGVSGKPTMILTNANATLSSLPPNYIHLCASLYSISLANLMLGSHPNCKAFVQTTGSNWNRLINEMRRTDGLRHDAVFVDLESGEW